MIHEQDAFDGFDGFDGLDGFYGFNGLDGFDGFEVFGYMYFRTLIAEFFLLYCVFAR